MTDRDDDARREDAARQRVRIRRAPRLGVFVVLGVVVGVVVALILTSLFRVDPKVGFAATAGYFAIYGIVFGALLGALVGLVLDAVSRRRARDAHVERERVESPGVEGSGEPERRPERGEGES